MIHVGTSGFQYKDWVGPFYPEGLAESRWLEYYASEFQTCELNYTFYRLPAAVQLGNMARRVPENFTFALKAYQGITHEREGVKQLLASLNEAVQPLKEEGKLGAILLQFPYSFKPSEQADTALLEQCRESLPELPLVAEFRNRQWLEERTFALLRGLNIGFCCVDEPRLRGLMPPIAVATADVAYVRFHGRNAAKWWHHEEAWERYDYTYKPEELEEWVPKIRSLDEQAEHTYVYANNHWQGQAVDTARQIRLLL
ncbi:MAG: DUF72 domain-containing protein [Anaerolineae bacterium]